MKLSTKEIRRRVTETIYHRTKDQISSHYGLIEIMFDVIEEREKYRDHRA